MLFLCQHKAVAIPEGEALDMGGVEAAMRARTLAAVTATRVFSPLLRAQEDEGAHLVYISPLPASALSLAAEADSHGWGALGGAAAGASLAGLAAAAAVDAQLRAPQIEVTSVHVGWGFGTLEESQATATQIVEAVRHGTARLVVGATEQGLDAWARVLPGQQSVAAGPGWISRIVRGSLLFGALSKGEWATLVAGIVVGLEIGIHKGAKL